MRDNETPRKKKRARRRDIKHTQRKIKRLVKSSVEWKIMKLTEGEEERAGKKGGSK